MVHNLDEKVFKEKIFDYSLGDNAPLLIKKNSIIEFWVTWCPHCQAMIPRYGKLSEMYPNIDCYRIEMEQHPDLADLFGIEGFPTFVFITPKGKMSKWEGELPLDNLEELTEKYFKV